MKMYRERQFLGLFTVHYHYRTENRDSSLQLGTKQPKITTLLFDLFNEKDMETIETEHWFRLWFGASQAPVHYLNQS